MASIGDLVANLTVNSGPFVSGMKKSQDSTAAFASSAIKAIAGVAAAYISLNAAISIVSQGITASGESLKESNKLASVLDATRNAAGLAQPEYEALAKSVQKLTNFEDDAANGAIAMLAKFKTITGDEFKRATMLGADLAAVMDTDIASGAETLGKALAKPEDAMSKLRKAGILLTDEQDALIQSFVKVGDTASAQAVILDAVEGVVGGAAEKMADPFTQLDNSVGDVFESIGMAARAFAQGLFDSGLIAHVGDFSGSIEDMIPLFESLGVKAGGVMNEMLMVANKISDAIGEWASKGDAAAESFLDAAVAIATLGIGERVHEKPRKKLAEGVIWEDGPIPNDLIKPIAGGRGRPRGMLGNEADTDVAATGETGWQRQFRAEARAAFRVAQQSALIPKDFGLDSSYREGASLVEKKDKAGRMNFSGAMEKGGESAYSAIVAAMGASGDTQQLMDANKTLKEINKNIKAKGISQGEVPVFVESIA